MPGKPNPVRFLHGAIYFFLSALLVGVVLSVFSSSTANKPEVVKIDQGGTEHGKPGGPPPAQLTEIVPGSVSVIGTSQSGASVVMLALMAMSFVGLLLWSGWLIFGPHPSTPKKVAGVTVAAAASLLGAKEISGALFKDVKIDSIFKLDHANVNWTKGTRNGPTNDSPFPSLGLGADRIGTIGAFPVGFADFEDEGKKSSKQALADQKQVVQGQLNDVVNKLNDPAIRDQLGLIMLVGSADKRGLHGGLRARFDSNAGLAQARAEWVRRQLEGKGPKGVPFLLLSTGPMRTDHGQSEKDWQEDRSVTVWAMRAGSSRAR